MAPFECGRMPAMKTMLVHALLATLLLVGCGSSQVTADPMSSLSFLEGEWRSDADGMLSEERWTRDGQVLIGSAQITAEGEVVHAETLRIEQRAGVTVYIASPAGETPTEFELTESSDHHVVFENPAHDFPSKIAYERNGDQLNARISGSGHDPMSWTFSRVTN